MFKSFWQCSGKALSADGRADFRLDWQLTWECDPAIIRGKISQTPYSRGHLHLSKAFLNMQGKDI